MSPADPKKRFSDRVEDYDKFRPHYPKEIITLLKILGVVAPSAIADIGSGTGIFSSLLLSEGFRVFAVEPNAEMRKTAERALSHQNHFQSISGSAEKTELPDLSVDAIVVAQAFHWFEPHATQREFMRILRPNGIILLLWNDRRIQETAFAQDYESLIKNFGTDYSAVNHRNITVAQIQDFLGHKDYGSRIIYNFQDLSFSGLMGRLTSSSYLPNKDDPRFHEMTKAAQALFDRYQQNGIVRIEYDTKVYFARKEQAVVIQTNRP